MQRELTLSQISRQLGLPKSTALNLIRTLESRGYLLYSPHSQTYQLGYNVMTLSYNLRTSMPIIQYALPFLEELQVKTGENIYLTSHIDGQALYLEGVYPSIRIGNYSVAGKRLPLHCTGCGKAMLAYLPEDEFEAVSSVGACRRLRRTPSPRARASSRNAPPFARAVMPPTARRKPSASSAWPSPSATAAAIPAALSASPARPLACATNFWKIMPK